MRGLPAFFSTGISSRKIDYGDWVSMPLVCPRVFAAIIALFSLLVPLPGFARAQRSALDTYAITNARIVPVSGPVIERGTVVVRNGLIAAVGANVSAPPDARTIDETGARR